MLSLPGNELREERAGILHRISFPRHSTPRSDKFIPQRGLLSQLFLRPSKGNWFWQLRNETTCYLPIAIPSVLVRVGLLGAHGPAGNKNPFTQWCQRAPSGSWKTNFFAAKGCAAQDTSSYPLTEITALTLVCHGQIRDAHSTATQHSSVPSAPRVWG